MAEEKKVETWVEKTIFTMLILSICLVFPLYILSKTPSYEILSTNTMIATLLIMLTIPLLDLIYNFKFLKAYDADDYSTCETNLTLVFMLSFLVGSFVFMIRAFLNRGTSVPTQMTTPMTNPMTTPITSQQFYKQF